MTLTPDIFSAAYPVTQEHLRWALDVQRAQGVIDEDEYTRQIRALDAEVRGATPPDAVAL